MNKREYHRLARHLPAKPAEDIPFCSIFPFYSIFTYTWFGTKWWKMKLFLRVFASSKHRLATSKWFSVEKRGKKNKKGNISNTHVNFRPHNVNIITYIVGTYIVADRSSSSRGHVKILNLGKWKKNHYSETLFTANLFEILPNNLGAPALLHCLPQRGPWTTKVIHFTRYEFGINWRFRGYNFMPTTWMLCTTFTMHLCASLVHYYYYGV